LPFNAANTVAVAKFLPPAALDVFCKAANEAEQVETDHNGCIRTGWAAVAKAGWVKPETGKKYILKDDGCTISDGPGAGDVHVDVPLGSGKKPPKRKPYGDATVKFDTEATVFKVDDSLGLVFGWAIVCNTAAGPYFDSQGDWIPEDSMLHAAADFMKNSRVARDMHQGDEIGPVVFAWPMTADIAKAMGMQTDTTGLMIAMLPPASILEKFKSGEYSGFSIGGFRVEDEEVDA
jgi:hypothetical protein